MIFERDQRMEEYLRVGVITTTHGVHGEMKVYPTTDDPSRFKKLKKVTASTSKSREEWEIEQVRFFKQFVILKVKGIDDMDHAALYRNADLLVAREEAVPCQENEYYIADIIGLTVVTEDGTRFGEVVDVLATGANDCYEVKRDGEKNTVLLPASLSCVRKVDLLNRVMTVVIPDGLLD